MPTSRSRTNTARPSALTVTDIAQLMLGGLFAAMALAQLGSFERYSAAIESYGLFGREGAIAVSLLLAALEVAAVPVLFKLLLPGRARQVSTVAVVAVPLTWLSLMTAALAQGLSPVTGVFGGFVRLGLDVYIYGAMIGLAILAFVVARRLWAAR
ncbi:hypothetical protein JNJ66_02555 [Candidatus Saccharibacteria bacterium]|nr:hypothetical protein [Candidatus Saccharibacteria bacterium]